MDFSSPATSPDQLAVILCPSGHGFGEKETLVGVVGLFLEIVTIGLLFPVPFTPDALAPRIYMPYLPCGKLLLFGIVAVPEDFAEVHLVYGT